MTDDELDLWILDQLVEDHNHFNEIRYHIASENINDRKIVERLRALFDKGYLEVSILTYADQYADRDRLNLGDAEQKNCIRNFIEIADKEKKEKFEQFRISVSDTGEKYYNSRGYG